MQRIDTIRQWIATAKDKGWTVQPNILCADVFARKQHIKGDYLTEAASIAIISGMNMMYLRGVAYGFDGVAERWVNQWSKSEEGTDGYRDGSKLREELLNSGGVDKESQV
jgi:hypothetical protein